MSTTTRNSWHVLAVEDSDMDFELIRRSIRSDSRPWEIARAASGSEFTLLLDSLGATPALVLLDVNLPDRDGIELIAELKRKPCTSTSPIVVFSSSSQEGDRQRAIAAGADDYFVKPLKAPAFLESVETMIRRWVDGTEVRANDN